MDNPKVKLINLNLPSDDAYHRKLYLSTAVELLLQWMYEMNKLNDGKFDNFIMKTSSNEFGECNGIYFEITEKGIEKTWK